MDFVTRGLGASFRNDILLPLAPWPKTTGAKPHHPRLNPVTGGGRRLRHPYYDPVIYPRNPDRTINFLDDPIFRTRSVVTKTLDAAAVDHFRDPSDARTVTEIWQAGNNELSTLTRFFRQLLRYRTDILPVDQYVAWVAPDLSPKRFFIEILDVRLGTTEDYSAEELGKERPYYMRETLSVAFKFVREIAGAAAVGVFGGL